uniref:Large ribosomal subunit protein bL9c n=1 Tax=Bostrychia simpliciuscula TaxID=324754 RepID=A0A1Z1M8E4_9FLOR|nr:ribosomal protein L9 [Bostrychia simpliciuscula]ARW62163.1 ribosomal protein L9 [Bostrychia simpliciuscula]
MKKKINIILIKSFLHLGEKGRIINVSPGYALNYLIPNQIAEIATKNKTKHLEMLKKRKNNQVKANEISNNKLKEKLEKIGKISIYRRKGENNYIFGRITEKDINNYIIKYTGIKLDKKQIKIFNIKKLGIFKTNIEISSNINTVVKLNTIPINI